MVKFLLLNLWYAATTLGFSMRQGPHQLAQKSMSTYLPRNEESATGLPVVSACANSIALLPTSPILLSSIISFTYLPKYPSCTSFVNAPYLFSVLVISSLSCEVTTITKGET